MSDQRKAASGGCGAPVGWAGAIPVYCGRMAVLCRRCKGLPESPSGSSQGVDQ